MVNQLCAVKQLIKYVVNQLVMCVMNQLMCAVNQRIICVVNQLIIFVVDLLCCCLVTALPRVESTRVQLVLNIINFTSTYRLNPPPTFRYIAVRRAFLALS